MREENPLNHQTIDDIISIIINELPIFESTLVTAISKFDKGEPSLPHGLITEQWYIHNASHVIVYDDDNTLMGGYRLLDLIKDAKFLILHY